MNALMEIQPERPLDAYRMSTDAAGACGEIVKRTAKPIQGRKFVSVEGWQAIAIAHGCAASARGVERVDGGIRAIGEVRRMSDGQLIAQGEGFVGEDEETWFGGTNKWGKTVPKRNEYAIRAMAQTRAISRACRSAFAHVVVMIDAELSTTPAEEVPEGGFDERPAEQPRQQKAETAEVEPIKADVMITEDQRDILTTQAAAAKVSLQAICKRYDVSDVMKLTAEQYGDALQGLNLTIEKNKRAGTESAKPTTEDILEDEIPY